MTYRDTLGFLLGLQGAALLRAQAGDYADRSFTEARIAEIRAMLDADRAEFGEPAEVGAIDIATGYRGWAATYDEPGNPLVEVEGPVVRAILDTLPTGRALDAACGTGRHARHLAELGNEVVGVDASPDMLVRARENLAGAEFHLGDLTDLPLPDGGFDTVVCGLALGHLPVLEPAMAEFHRVLRPGGQLVVSDVHLVSLYLGGVAGGTDADGRPGLMPASRWRASDYLQAALPLGFQVRRCVEPSWGPSPWHGGPLARRWCPEGAAAAYEGAPAAIVWHFQRA